MGNKNRRKKKMSSIELRKLKKKISLSVPRSKGVFTKKCTGEQQRAATSSAAEVSSTGVQFAEVPPAVELGTDGPKKPFIELENVTNKTAPTVLEQELHEAGPARAPAAAAERVPARAAAAPASWPAAAGHLEQGKEDSPLSIDGTDNVIEQQPASEIAEVAEEPKPPLKPLPKLRQRRPTPMTSAMSTRSNIRVAAGDKEKLAGLVRGHPVLYNTHYAHFRDKAQRRYAWQDISRRMLRPDSECIEIWKLLKSNYSQALRIRKKKMEQGLNVRLSKYENFMSFVKPFLKVCKNAPPTTTATAESPFAPAAAPDWGSDVSRGAPERSAATPARAGYVPALPAQPQRNTIVELFRNLGETVKNFPKDVKIRVKSEVLKVVRDAREFILSNNTVEQLFVVEDIVIKEEPLELQ